MHYDQKLEIYKLVSSGDIDPYESKIYKILVQKEALKDVQFLSSSNVSNMAQRPILGSGGPQSMRKALDQYSKTPYALWKEILIEEPGRVREKDFNPAFENYYWNDRVHYSLHVHSLNETDYQLDIFFNEIIKAVFVGRVEEILK